MNRIRSFLLSLPSIFVFMFLWAPMLLIIIFSFNKAKYGTLWKGFTFHWYGQVFAKEALLHAVQTSLIVVAVTIVVSTLLGTGTAIAFGRFNFPGKEIIRSILVLPLIIPSIIFGVMLLIWFVTMHFPLGLLTICIAHITFSVPLSTLVILARMQRLDPALEEAARDLGGDEFTVLFRITLPLLSPGIFASILLVFPWSFNDYVITFFVAGPGTTTLPIYTWGLIRMGISPELNALAAMITVTPFALIGMSRVINSISRWVKSRV